MEQLVIYLVSKSVLGVEHTNLPWILIDCIHTHETPFLKQMCFDIVHRPAFDISHLY